MHPRYYNQWVSLLGTLLCVVVMFLMDHITALITFILIICLYICVSVRKPDANWGSSTQAQAFVTALKASQNLSRLTVITLHPENTFKFKFKLNDNGLYIPE